jgi:RNA polymerase sigma-70 factor (ECF subfamily)
MLTRTWAVAKPAESGIRVTVTNQTDAELVAACLAGEREAFDVIVERHRRHVYQLCYRFVANHEDASDLAQDVFIRAYRGLRTFKSQASLGTWLYRIGVNVCLNRVAVKAPRPESLDLLIAASDQRVASHEETAADALLRDGRSCCACTTICRTTRSRKSWEVQSGR